MTEPTPDTITDRDVYITRSFAAPRDLVWKFWTDPERLTEWFGPSGIHTPLANISVDLVEGGHWNLGMTDDTTDEIYPLSATVMKVIEGEYLELVIVNARGGEIEDVFLRVQFHDHGDTTRLTLHQGPFTPELRDLTRDGWTQSFDKLDITLKEANS